MVINHSLPYSNITWSLAIYRFTYIWRSDILLFGKIKLRYEHVSAYTIIFISAFFDSIK